MPSRNELNLRARAVNVTAVNYPNDSKLEQAVLYAEKTAAASGAATVLAVSNATTKDDLAGVAGSANV